MTCDITFDYVKKICHRCRYGKVRDPKLIPVELYIKFQSKEKTLLDSERWEVKTVGSKFSH